MQITETVSEGLKREFRIVVPAVEIEVRVNDRINELAPTIQMRGFRPGKVSTNLIRKRYGPAVMQEVIEKVANEMSETTLTRHQLRPVRQPQLEFEEFDVGQDLEATLRFELMPEIEPVDFGALTLDKYVIDPTVEEVDNMIIAEATRLGLGFRPIAETRGSRSDDFLLIDLACTMDGEPLPEGSMNDYRLNLGEPDPNLPEFNEQLIDVSAGQDVSITHVFPHDHDRQDWAGKEVVVAVTVKEIQERREIVLDDEFARTRLQAETLEDVRKRFTAGITESHKQATADFFKRSLLDRLDQGRAFELPESMVNEEYAAICNASRRDSAAEADAKTTVEMVEDNTGTPAPEATAIEPPPAVPEHGHDHDHSHDVEIDQGYDEITRADFRRMAERRVRLALRLQEVAAMNNIELSEAEIDMIRGRVAADVKARFDEQQNTAHIAQIFFEAIQRQCYEDKIINFITELATINDKTVSVGEFAALMAAKDKEDPFAAEDATLES